PVHSIRPGPGCHIDDSAEHNTAIRAVVVDEDCELAYRIDSQVQSRSAARRSTSAIHYVLAVQQEAVLSCLRPGNAQFGAIAPRRIVTILVHTVHTWLQNSQLHVTAPVKR